MRVFHSLVWLPYVPLDIWLGGSVLLPFMLLVLWGGSKWRKLNWSTKNRKRWVLIWGCYAVLKVIIFAGFIWVRYYPDFLGGFDAVGWEAQAVWMGLYTLHIHPSSLLIEFFLGFSLKAIVDAAIDCGLATIAWWVYSLLAHKVGGDRKIVPMERYGISLLFSACAFGIANHLHFAREGTCWDCFRPDGVPFTLFHEGGFAGGEGFVWKGVIADSLIALGIGLVIGLVWNKLAVRNTNQPVSSS